MNKFVVSLLVFLSALGFFAAAQMSVELDEDDEPSVSYHAKFNIKEGWNLVPGLLYEEQITRESEIKKKDIRAIYFYSNIDKRYYLAYPRKSPEFEKYLENYMNACGDNTCTAYEREYFENWCSLDCKTDLTDDIINHLNIIGKETVTLSENEQKVIGAPGFSRVSFTTYWDKDGYANQPYSTPEDVGNCESWGYGDIVCVVLHNNIGLQQSDNIFGYNIFTQSDDGNPNNDNFGRIVTVRETEGAQVFVKAEMTSQQGQYRFVFYELDEPSISASSFSMKRIPSFDEQFISQANWVYSKKAGELKYRAIVVRLNQRTIRQGWNFISITPDMVGPNLKLTDLAGDCNIERAYMFNDNSWASVVPDSLLMEESLNGKGIIIKVVNDCRFGILSEEEVPNPPGLDNA